MNGDGIALGGLDDPRLAVHAASGLPVWLWSADGSRILWANPVGARLFHVESAAESGARVFGPADPHRRQIVRLAARLRPDAAPRLERLRGFGALLGRLVTCACARVTLADGTEAVLIAAAEPVGRAMPLSERLQRLVEDADIPLAAFSRDGVFIGASRAARALLGFRNLTDAGLDTARESALKDGRIEWPVGTGHLVLQRVGSGADIGLIVRLEQGGALQEALPSDSPVGLAPSNEIEAFDEEDEQDLTPQVAASDDPTQHNDAPDDWQLGETQIPDWTPHEDAPGDDVPPRTHPLRFMWEIDARERFVLRSDELARLIGPRATATLDAPWQDVATAYASYGRMATAILSRSAWSGVSLALPTDDDGEPLVAELSGIPTYEDGEFAGYRGFGLVHDLEALTDLERRRQSDTGRAPRSLSAHSTATPAMDFAPLPEQNAMEPADNPPETSIAHEDFGPSVDTHPNIVAFPAPADGRSPVLTPVENNAFNELARELSARLDAEPAPEIRPPASAPAASDRRADEGRLLDRLPSAVLVHRAGGVLYANAAFLASSGFGDLTSLKNSGFDPDSVAHAQRIALDWDGEPAEAVILDPPRDAPTASERGAADAEDLGAILDAANEAILMFDAAGSILACNRAAERLFDVGGGALTDRPIANLFAPDSRTAIAGGFAHLKSDPRGRTLEVRLQTGGGIERPVRLTLGRARANGPNFYAVVHDIAPLKAGEAEVVQARRQTERVLAGKADILARISHEMRAPLNAIIGFADVMIEQRFGPLGNERYADYLRDIRGCGERVVAIVDDLLDLSRIETGQRDLAPAPQNLNDLVEQCVAAMQPQANRERIIIRSSLVHPLPPVVADGAALRQIALNLIGNSIHLANPGGQVIVSTLHADSGDVVLRVRDTGHGLNDNEMASALAPFRPLSDADSAPAQIRLSLTRALAEANHARFNVRPAPYAGTLIEVAFPVGGST